MRIVSPTVWCFLVFLVGCSGSSDGGKLVPVQGKITLASGKPLTLGSVQFQPDPTKGKSNARIAFGTVDDNGVFKLTTDGKDGAVEGFYKVVIGDAMPKDMSKMPKDGKMPSSEVPQVYRSLESTPLTVEVKSGAPASTYEFQLMK